MRQLELELRANLEAKSEALYPEPNPESQLALNRLLALARAAPTLLVMLSEPWQPLSGRQRKLLFTLAQMHLYSRILDDAVDERQDCHLSALLLSQAWHWQNCQALARARPGLARKSAKLIEATVKAANRDEPTAQAWAAKNKHLLLIPLYLGKKMEFYRRAESDLLIAIALLQAEDELAQKSGASLAIYCDLIKEAANSAVRLKRMGWKRLASRLISGAKALITCLERA